MASVLRIYKEVALINDDNLCANKHTTVSYDEKAREYIKAHGLILDFWL